LSDFVVVVGQENLRGLGCWAPTF